MLNKIIEAIMQRDAIRYNKEYAEKATKDTTEMYSAGWDALEDGTVVQTKGNIIAVKKGSAVITHEIDGYVNMGKFVGDIKRTIKTIELTGAQKQSLLAQAIVTKYYTVPRM